MPEPNSGDPGLFEIIHTTRSMRRLKPDAVPDALIRKILETGVCAPSGGNMQRWRFLVVTDRKLKETVAEHYRRAWEEQVGPLLQRQVLAPSASPACSMRRNICRIISTRRRCGSSHAWWEISVWAITPTGRARRYTLRCKNMLLAARALGLGATLTTLILRYAKEVETALGLPSDAHCYALLPIGYPMGRFGPVRRTLDNVVYGDRWGEPYPGVQSLIAT